MPDADVGDYVLVHAGYAISVIDEAEADETYSLLAELAEAAAWEDSRDRRGETGGSLRQGRVTGGRVTRPGDALPPSAAVRPAALRRLADELAAEAEAALVRRGGSALTFMEVCGTHTMAIARFGLRDLLPPEVRLVSGPGCPVCVTAMSDLDAVIALARLPEVTLATFGDLVRVPASRSSLAAERAAGADVRVVYSPRDAVEIAAAEPEREVVFAGIGFETTAPTVAAALLEAQAREPCQLQRPQHAQDHAAAAPRLARAGRDRHLAASSCRGT